jgi:hypothetical protein
MISIIIPTFNEEKVIESTLRTLAPTLTLPTKSSFLTAAVSIEP